MSLIDFDKIILTDWKELIPNTCVTVALEISSLSMNDINFKYLLRMHACIHPDLIRFSAMIMLLIHASDDATQHDATQRESHN